MSSQFGSLYSQLSQPSSLDFDATSALTLPLDEETHDEPPLKISRVSQPDTAAALQDTAAPLETPDQQDTAAALQDPEVPIPNIREWWDWDADSQNIDEEWLAILRMDGDRQSDLAYELSTTVIEAETNTVVLPIKKNTSLTPHFADGITASEITGSEITKASVVSCERPLS